MHEPVGVRETSGLSKAQPHSVHPCDPIRCAAAHRPARRKRPLPTELVPCRFSKHAPSASAHPPYGPRSGSRRACSRRRRCAMDKTLGESRAGARPQHWGDLAVLLASSSGTQGKADDVSADPRLLPPSAPELGSAGQRQHQLRLPREAVPGEHVLHGRAAAETMVDAASERRAPTTFVRKSSALEEAPSALFRWMRRPNRMSGGGWSEAVKCVPHRDLEEGRGLALVVVRGDGEVHAARVQDRVDDAGEPVQLGPPYRLRPPIPRRRRIAQHLLHRPAVDAEPPNRGGTSPAPRHNRQGAMDGEFLRRRDGDDRPQAPPRVVPYSSAVYTSTITASPHCTSRPGSGRPTIFRTRSPAIVRTLNSRNALPIAAVLQWIIALTQSAMGRPALRPLFRCPP